MKYISLFVVLILSSTVLMAQSSRSQFYLIGSSNNGDLQIRALTGWQPWSADSTTNPIFSGKFSLAEYDSVSIWVASSSVNGTANWRAVLEGSPSGSILLGNTFGTNFSQANSYDSLGTAADTTNVKLERLKYIGIVGTKGAADGRIRFVKNGAASSQTMKDTFVNVFISGKKRPYTGAPQ